MVEPARTPSLPAFDEVLSSFADQAIATQQKLDALYVSRLADFQDFAKSNGFAPEFLPLRLALHNETISCQFTTSSLNLREIRLFNQAIAKRYRAQSAIHSVRVAIRRNPAGPGQTINNK